MTTSLTNFNSDNKQKHEDIKMLLTSRKKDAKRIVKLEAKTGDYLYKRLEGT